MEKGQGKGTDTLQTDKVFTRKEYIEREAAYNAIVRNYAVDDQLSELDAIPAADVRPTGSCDRWKTMKQSNADRIRAMTDAELAEFISSKARTFGEEFEGYMSALDWLRQEGE